MKGQGNNECSSLRKNAYVHFMFPEVPRILQPDLLYQFTIYRQTSMRKLSMLVLKKKKVVAAGEP